MLTDFLVCQTTALAGTVLLSVGAANDCQLPAESKSSEGCLQNASQVKAGHEPSACRRVVTKL